MTGSMGWPSMPSDDERPRRRRGWLVLLILVVVFGVALVVYLTRTPSENDALGVVRSVSATDPLARAPTGFRVRVRVLNASGTRGLARRVTLELRDRGFDVVEYDTERGDPRSSTVIVVHTGHEEWAERLRRALGTGTLDARPDSLRFVDLTVYVGRDWKPSAEALRP